MKSNSMQKRLDEIDICRGIGIILVVLGHALKQTGETNRVFDLLLSWIYSFHMPLFFVLSGLVAVKLLNQDTWEKRLEFIKARAIRLLIPYFAVGLVYLPVKVVLSRYAVKPFELSSAWRLILGENPNVSLWFLYILFWCSVLCVLICNRKNLRVVLGIACLLCIAAYAFDWPLRLPKYLFFFVLGIYYRVSYDKITAYVKKRKAWLFALVVFAAAFAGLYLGNITALNVLTALSGICIAMYISLCLSGKGHVVAESVPGKGHVAAESVPGKGHVVAKCLRELGTYSMDIYILSEPVNTVLKLVFWVILKWNYIVCTFICFLFGLALPIPASKGVIRRVKALRLLVLGIK